MCPCEVNQINKKKVEHSVLPHHQSIDCAPAVMFDIYPFIYYYARPIIKWFLRKFTRLCELQRICYGSEFGASRYKGIEQSLEMSRVPEIKTVIVVLNEKIQPEFSVDEFNFDVVQYAVQTVLRVKAIKPQIHPDFPKILTTCLQAIWGYRRLFLNVEWLRTTTYDTHDAEHERKLLRLWDLLMPDQPLQTRVTKQWQDIGFQVVLFLHWIRLKMCL